MTRGDLEHFKNLLIERQENLNNWLQTFAPSEDEIRKVRTLLNDIDKALGRVENSSFGVCEVCKGEVELSRLEVQPVRQVCLSCITEEERTTLEHELTVASRIHRALLPQSYEKIDGFDLAVKSIAAGSIGGDYYDFLPSINNSGSRIVIGDTMGKGLPAGLLMANLQGALRIYGEQLDSPAALVTRLNQWLCRNIPVTKFVTLFCARIQNGNSKESKLTFTNAGHPHPILIRKSGELELLDTDGGILGVHEQFTFKDKSVSIAPGDILVLYTDGITEAENYHGQMFGEERLISYIKNRKSEPFDNFVDILLSEIQSFSEKPELEDDTTVIALRKS
jgi:sigma-B regulation protein RsbU (phosphoserine phosphatase)